ncbi:uncharacterized protein C9orf85 homolog isoform X2 [Octopus sinensis]|uniref:Uncharacterized protein C9orf85 homolog isoform X2 n=1 Tax=Octopus sinensis TaxID=2607531 RepID=A0A7E6FDD0_9MOLL|nr:uncharacterized protein C9orf85 homolog isoform X2 [Octopus sinensis]
MSSQKGNVKKAGPPRHRNNTAFRNNLHDNSIKQKMINSLEITGLCDSCTRVIEWKIKYKKYKPLTNPKTCSGCSKKAIKRAYHFLCQQCAENRQICPKCVKNRVATKKNDEAGETNPDSKCADRCSDCSSECSDNATQVSGHHIKLEPVSTEKTSSNLSEEQSNSDDGDEDDDDSEEEEGKSLQKGHSPVNLSLTNLAVSN